MRSKVPLAAQYWEPLKALVRLMSSKPLQIWPQLGDGRRLLTDLSSLWLRLASTISEGQGPTLERAVGAPAAGGAAGGALGRCIWGGGRTHPGKRPEKAPFADLQEQIWGATFTKGLAVSHLSRSRQFSSHDDVPPPPDKYSSTSLRT